MIPLLERLYKEIEHGDAEHRKWLWDKLDDFSRREFKAYYCDHKEWREDMTGLFICEGCGIVEDDLGDLIEKVTFKDGRIWKRQSEKVE